MAMQTVDKKQLLRALQMFTDITLEEAKSLRNLKESYPYSQVLHALAARLSKDHKMESNQFDLQMAAVYSADRSVLKEVMTMKPEVIWPASHEAIGLTHPETPESILDRPNVQPSDATEDLADKVLQDLKKLNILKNNFEHMFDEGSQQPKESQEETSDESSAESEAKKKLPPGRKRGNKKAHRIVELAKGLDKEESSENDEGNGERKKGEDIIESIKTSKKKINPDTDKQREQMEIIDEFIKSQPSISPAQLKRDFATQEDFSLKSGEFGDNVISETLVDILLQQGKKDKAIEVLKKLIWKFPQKKSYFAAQIEELKK